MPSPLQHRHHLARQWRKAARKELHKAITTADPQTHAAAAQDAAVHKVRKHLKKLRAMVRLLRDGVGGKDFDKDNRTLRDAARPLSPVRDAAALVATIRSLRERDARSIDRHEAAAVERALEARRSQTRGQVLDATPTFEATRSVLNPFEQRIDHWQLPHGKKDVERGLRHVYRRARQAMCTAQEERTDAALHEWRKRTKDLRYLAELLAVLHPRTLPRLADETHRLTDLLGEDHDLAVLRDFLEFDWAAGKDAPGKGTLHPAIDRRRAALQRSALRAGKRLFAPKPSARF